MMISATQSVAPLFYSLILHRILTWQERRGGAREMSCSERPASTPVPVTVAHISRLKLHVRSRFASVAAHTAEAEKSVSAL
jgi:hypothetical protein